MADSAARRCRGEVPLGLALSRPGQSKRTGYPLLVNVIGSLLMLDFPEELVAVTMA